MRGSHCSHNQTRVRFTEPETVVSFPVDALFCHPLRPNATIRMDKLGVVTRGRDAAVTSSKISRDAGPRKARLPDSARCEIRSCPSGAMPVAQSNFRDQSVEPTVSNSTATLGVTCYSKTQAAGLLNCCIRTIGNLVARGDLKATRIAGRVVIRHTDLTEFLDRNSERAA